MLEAKETAPERSMAALALIRRLQPAKDGGRGKAPEERIRLRREKARPILEDIGTGITESPGGIFPKARSPRRYSHQ